MAYKFSPSSLSLMNDCNKCFWLRFNKKFKRPQGPFPSLPGGMDKMLKIYFDSHRNKNTIPLEIKSIDKNLKLFNEMENLIEWRKNMKGIRWEDKKGNIISGAIDDALIKNNKIIVIDFKTGGYPPKDTLGTRYEHQMNFYYFLLNKIKRKTENYGYILYYYPEKINNCKTNFINKVVKIKIDIKKSEETYKKALKLLENKIPKPSEDCNFCKYGLNYNNQEEEFPEI